ncbi:hypothetical protein J2Z83_002417 [Virgibacillus natechei]|uniref:Uncharacterized protein n=1 Tax=Virgibacillus natechei TaxID=1216297 RepID=A0ABS4IJW2_9BACI|nr:hypothetical protein [Virgibacillus natechei]MBP1970299.1 hypothetical protein [Virgibacillus natechei]UZD13126.1 hypothetical protein OLD84_00680 [Virgibacillus natechei]
MALAKLHYQKPTHDAIIFTVKEDPNDYIKKKQGERTKLLKRIPLEKLMD